jgi:hypothetical protein
VDTTQEVYLRPMTVMPVPAEEVPEPMAPAGADEEGESEKSAAKADAAVLDFAAKVLERMDGVAAYRREDSPQGNATDGEHVGPAAQPIPDLAPLPVEVADEHGNGNGHHIEEAA